MKMFIMLYPTNAHGAIIGGLTPILTISAATEKGRTTMSKFEFALCMVGAYHITSALVVKANNTLAAVLFKVLPFFFGLFEVLLSLRYAGIIG